MQGVGQHRGLVHGQPGALRQQVLGPLAQVLDRTEHVVPAAGVQAVGVLAQGVQQALGVHQTGQCLDLQAHPDAARGQSQPGFGEGQRPPPALGLRQRVELGQIQHDLALTEGPGAGGQVQHPGDGRFTAKSRSPFPLGQWAKARQEGVRDAREGAEVGVGPIQVAGSGREDIVEVEHDGVCARFQAALYGRRVVRRHDQLGPPPRQRQRHRGGLPVGELAVGSLAVAVRSHSRVLRRPAGGQLQRVPVAQQLGMQVGGQSESPGGQQGTGRHLASA